MPDFAIGDRVMFTPDSGTPIAGILTRYNKKTVTDSGQHWNFAAGFLRKAPAATEAPTAANVIALNPSRPINGDSRRAASCE